jgi:RimJ/RimL family protein N-acetyltransferase
MAEDGRIVGLGNVFPIDTPGAGATAEIAIIIDDDHQGLGIGRRLLGHLIDLAGRLEFDGVVASVLSDNRAMIALLDQCGLAWTRTVESGVTEFQADLPVRR